MSKHVHSTVLTPTLTMSVYTDGYWLYDKTRGMNLSMRAKTQEQAFVEALTYYQQRLEKVETDYRVLKARVDHFVCEFIEEE